MFGDRPLMTGVLGHEGVGRVVEGRSSIYSRYACGMLMYVCVCVCVVVGSDASAELMDKRVGVG